MAVSAHLRRLLQTEDLRAASPALVELLVAAGEPVQLPGDGVVPTDGEQADALYLLVSGEVALVAPIEDPPWVLRRAQPGEFFGHEAALGRAPRLWSARCSGRVTALRYRRPDMERLLRGGWAFSDFVEERLRVSTARLLREVHARAEAAEREGAAPEVLGRLRGLSRALG